MAPLRPLNLPRCVLRPTTTITPSLSSTAAPATAIRTSTTLRRSLSTTPARFADHGSHYDPPSGWLFGVRPGEKYQKEGWEGIWVWGFFGSLGLGVVGYMFKPDSSIQTWALEEARRRLEVEGILKDDDGK